MQTWWLPTRLGNTLLFLGSLTKTQPHSCLEQRFLISDMMCQTRGLEWFYDTVLAKETQGKVWTSWGNSGKEWFSVTGGCRWGKSLSCIALCPLPLTVLGGHEAGAPVVTSLFVRERLQELQSCGPVTWSQWALNQAKQPPTSQLGDVMGEFCLVQGILANVLRAAARSAHRQSMLHLAFSSLFKFTDL